METATFVRNLGWSPGDARLYRIGDGSAHLVVSAVVTTLGGPETMIWRASADGEVLDWMELDGSFRGGLDHGRALRAAGFEVV